MSLQNLSPLLPKKLSISLAILAFAFAPAARAQSAGKIVSQYLHAMGGAGALEKVRSASFTGTLRDSASGLSGSYSLILKSPDKFYSEILLGPDHSIEAFNGKSAWTQDASSAPRTLTGAGPAIAAASALFWNGRLARAKNDKIEIRMIGVEIVGSHEAYRLALSFPAGVTRDVFFDARSHLLVREVLNGDAQMAPPSGDSPVVEYDYSDYRDVEGIPAPHTVDIHRGNRLFRVTRMRVEFNSPAADSIFDFPSLSGRPLPDISTLLRDVVKNQDAIENIQKQYTCRVTEMEEKTGSQGIITSTTVREYDAFYVAGEEVRHLVSKNGQPLTGDGK